MPYDTHSTQSSNSSKPAEGDMDLEMVSDVVISADGEDAKEPMYGSKPKRKLPEFMQKKNKAKPAKKARVEPKKRTCIVCKVTAAFSLSGCIQKAGTFTCEPCVLKIKGNHAAVQALRDKTGSNDDLAILPIAVDDDETTDIDSDVETVETKDADACAKCKSKFSFDLNRNLSQPSNKFVCDKCLIMCTKAHCGAGVDVKGSRCRTHKIKDRKAASKKKKEAKQKSMDLDDFDVQGKTLHEQAEELANRIKERQHIKAAARAILLKNNTDGKWFCAEPNCATYVDQPGHFCGSHLIAVRKETIKLGNELLALNKQIYDSGVAADAKVLKELEAERNKLSQELKDAREKKITACSTKDCVKPAVNSDGLCDLHKKPEKKYFCENKWCNLPLESERDPCKACTSDCVGGRLSVDDKGHLKWICDCPASTKKNCLAPLSIRKELCRSDCKSLHKCKSPAHKNSGSYSYGMTEVDDRAIGRNWHCRNCLDKCDYKALGICIQGNCANNAAPGDSLCFVCECKRTKDENTDSDDDDDDKYEKALEVAKKLQTELETKGKRNTFSLCADGKLVPISDGLWNWVCKCECCRPRAFNLARFGSYGIGYYLEISYHNDMPMPCRGGIVKYDFGTGCYSWSCACEATCAIPTFDHKGHRLCRANQVCEHTKCTSSVCKFAYLIHPVGVCADETYRKKFHDRVKKCHRAECSTELDVEGHDYCSGHLGGYKCHEAQGYYCRFAGVDHSHPTRAAAVDLLVSL